MKPKEIHEMTDAEAQAKLRDLCERVHTGRYRSLPVRRVYIPKSDGGQRPLGVLRSE